MGTLASIITQINGVTGYSLPTSSGVILSGSTPSYYVLVSGSTLTDLINLINQSSGFDIPTSSGIVVTESNPGSGGPIIFYAPPPVSGTISTEGILPGRIIRADHVLRIINALNGVSANDIVMAGTLTVKGATTLTSSLSLPYIPTDGLLGITGGLVVGVVDNTVYASTTIPKVADYIVAPNQAYFVSASLLQPPSGSTLPTTSISNFLMFVNGLYAPSTTATMQESGSYVIITFNTSSLGYSLETDDELVVIGKWQD